jgi:hypothetical protein
MSDSEEREGWNTRFTSEEYIFGIAPNAFLASQRRLLKPGQRAPLFRRGKSRGGREASTRREASRQATPAARKANR